MSDILDDEIQREGGYSNDPNDPGGETMYGLTRKDNPEAWANGRPSYQTARDIYQRKFLDGAKIGLISDEALKHQVLDFAINSGPHIAIQRLQHLLGAAEDGVIGPATIEAISKVDARAINNRLVQERILLICRVVQRNPRQVTELVGLCQRALSFLI